MRERESLKRWGKRRERERRRSWCSNGSSVSRRRRTGKRGSDEVEARGARGGLGPGAAREPSSGRGWSLGVELLSNGARLLRLIWKGSGGGSLVGWRDREGSMDWIDGENEEGGGGMGIDGWDSSPRF